MVFCLQVLLAMRANVEDRGIKGDCTPLMEAASGGYVDIVKLLIANGADVNAQSSAGKKYHCITSVQSGHGWGSTICRSVHPISYMDVAVMMQHVH